MFAKNWKPIIELVIGYGAVVENAQHLDFVTSGVDVTKEKQKAQLRSSELIKTIESQKK